MNLKYELDRRADLQHLLFRRGWVVSETPLDNLTGGFPLYSGCWRLESFAGLNIATHRDLNGLHTYSNSRVAMMLLGHAYNPLTMEHRERQILEHIADAHNDPDEFHNRIDGLTGVFTLVWRDSGGIHFMTDPSGMQPCYYTVADGKLWLVSHVQLIGDLLLPPPTVNTLSRQLRDYRFYPNLPGAYLPADLSPFRDVRRVVANALYTSGSDGKITHRRAGFVGSRVTPMYYDEAVAEGARIMRNNLTLIARKWQRPAISLTGGIDSNTTFAAATESIDRFTAFSYSSASKEVPDVEAARKISDAFGVGFTVYDIPQTTAGIADYGLKSAIIDHSSAGYNPLPENEIRKRIFLEENCDIDVEVKSWVSETVRAACYHRYRRTEMPPLSARLYRNLYKIFLTDRALAHKVDKVFSRFIDEFDLRSVPSIYPPADVYYQEVAWGAWGGVNIQEMKYSFDITIPYNNRRWIELMFNVPLEKRLSDRHHLDMKKLLSRKLYDMNIHVENVSETAKRAKVLNAIFTINNLLPF